MSLCWYCHWGWPAPVAEIYRRYADIYGGEALQYGPAHIVWADENFDRGSIQWCLDHWDEYRRDDGCDAIRQSLVELLAIPDEIRDPRPPEYDGEHPERFPPPGPMVRV